MTGTAAAADLSPWAASYDAATGTRFIPVELWTGAVWDGSRELRMTPADVTFGKRGEKRVTGPVAWTRPGGETFPVYERDNRGKKQRFTLTPRGDGLGRVFDVSCNGGRARGTDMHYVYSPGRGLVSVDED